MHRHLDSFQQRTEPGTVPFLFFMFLLSYPSLNFCIDRRHVDIHIKQPRVNLSTWRSDEKCKSVDICILDPNVKTTKCPK